MQVYSLADMIYDYLLTVDKPNKNLMQLFWVKNLTLINDAIKVIDIWLQDNLHIKSLEEFIKEMK